MINHKEYFINNLCIKKNVVFIIKLAKQYFPKKKNITKIEHQEGEGVCGSNQGSVDRKPQENIFKTFTSKNKTVSTSSGLLGYPKIIKAHHNFIGNKTLIFPLSIRDREKKSFTISASPFYNGREYLLASIIFYAFNYLIIVIP